MAIGVKTGGRQKGTPNKISGEIRSMVYQALQELGGVEFLKKAANDNPTAFLSLVGKLMPNAQQEQLEHQQQKHEEWLKTNGLDGFP